MSASFVEIFTVFRLRLGGGGGSVGVVWCGVVWCAKLFAVSELYVC